MEIPPALARESFLYSFASLAVQLAPDMSDLMFPVRLWGPPAAAMSVEKEEAFLRAKRYCTAALAGAGGDAIAVATCLAVANATELLNHKPLGFIDLLVDLKRGLVTNVTDVARNAGASPNTRLRIGAYCEQIINAVIVAREYDSHIDVHASAYAFGMKERVGNKYDFVDASVDMPLAIELVVDAIV